MQSSNGDAKHPLSRLVGRYGQAHGQYLFGEYCLLIALGFEAFRARHTPEQLTRLAFELGSLGFWPSENQPPAAQGTPVPGDEADPFAAMEANTGPLDRVARSLCQPPLQLRLGADLFRALLEWATVASEATGEPVEPGAWFEPSRAALTQSLGFLPPPLALALEPELDGHRYRLHLVGEAVAEGCAYIGQDLALAPADTPPPPSSYPWESDPNGEGLIAWWPIGPSAEPPEGCARVHWIVAIDRHVTAQIRQHAEKLVSVNVTARLLNEAEAAGFDHEIERYVSVPELRLAFQTLVRQGLPLKPLPVLLEAMLGRILRRMAAQPLTPIEVEKLHRQLPLFPTAWLVGAARLGLGLPEAPPPRFRFAPAAPPAPAGPELPAPGTRARLDELAALASSQAPAVSALVAVLRVTGDRLAHALGPTLRWSLLAPLAPGPVPLEAQRTLGSSVVHQAAWRQRAGRALDAFAERARVLDGLQAWLADPQRPLSVEGRAALAALAALPFAAAREVSEAPPTADAWAVWRWQLNEPARLLAEALAPAPANGSSAP